MEQGNNNATNTPTVNTPTPQESVPVAANPPAKDDIVFANKPKKNRAMVLGMVFLGILAVGGIGFGIWEMMDGNSQKEQLNSQIDTLKSQNGELSEKINGLTVLDDGSGDGVSATYSNPIMSYSVGYQSSDVPLGDDGLYNFSISIKNGEIESCNTYSISREWVDTSSGGGSVESRKIYGDCGVNGLAGKVYKIVEIGEGQDSSQNYIAFILEDGSVQYAPLIDSMNKQTINLGEKLNVGGFVTDVIDVNVTGDNGGSGYGSTIFVLRDGSTKKYDESMF